MKVYLVGGGVRDMLLGKEPKDLDYVVVGSTVEEMLSLGYKQVGSDFPVFLHPISKDEYALARTEQVDGTGKHKGFSTFTKDVTIKEDLGRRDLTINSMAWDYEESVLIDPYDGFSDLKNKVLKATTPPAFEEDPVRVLRVARLLATLGEGWRIDFDLHILCRRMWFTRQNEVTKERVFKELDKALQTKHPDVFFQKMLGFSDIWFKEYYRGYGIPQPVEHHPEGCVYTHQQMCLSQAVKEELSPEQVFSTMCHDFGKARQYKTHGNLHGHEEAGVPLVNDFCDRLCVPNTHRQLALKVCKYHTKCHRAFDMKPNKIMRLFEDLGCLSDVNRLKAFTDCCRIDARGRTGRGEADYPQERYLMSCLQAVIATDTKAISKYMLYEGKSGVAIGEAIRVERINSIRKVRGEYKNAG